MDQRIYLLECKIFFRNKTLLTGILILLISGFAGLYFGKNFIERQKEVIRKAEKLQTENTARNIKYFGKELGLVLYHTKFSMASEPRNWAAFSNGQRDINPYLIGITTLGLEGQLYDTDLNNPTTLLLGNMDLAFVFIFIFPLIIIAFTYNLLSGEQESGIWGLLRSQSATPLKILWRKFAIRMAAIYLTALVLMAVAGVYLHLAADLRLLTVIVVLSLYLLCWFALSFWVISRGRSSSVNAVTLISCWVVLNILAPALVNVWLTRKYPVPEALETVVMQREGYHEKWDMDKRVALNSFYRHYPQFKKYPFPEELAFSWYWYFTMQQNGDDQAAPGARSMQHKLAQRNDFTNAVAFILPGIQTQLTLNGIAGSDLQQHLDFQQALRNYHEQLRLYFYPAIFQDQPAKSIDWSQFKLKHYYEDGSGAIWQSILSLVVFTSLLSGMAIYNFRKKMY
ncbi:DUF3526 domain-containing protein [Chitinophaga ginsengisegetis]|uniref:DUF3526 domain-containing protein n=1 Tax=Chitinophaga ginsengisegetis TaxID=393003 RepID=UPI000DBA1B25|nr:DUF3526 domain-containing protein [Chitinophaga ginsengisegetis]MDR6570645.1 ABC-2 type transport system permease protein [Chitinophaga ginsengisegetis]MDR6650379.1 ABC-2 type transport system permease protein [Chitinophaga ginsengisegetis]MDR6656502.1 ABC-2 type transport system permease protein [Chitinophaga ginsengisegetis]